MRRLFSSLVCLTPAAGWAHSFGTPYVPPIPLWMYVYGGAATLIVTFAVIGVFVAPSGIDRRNDARTVGNIRAFRIPRGLVGILRFASLGALLLTIAAGLLGTQDPAHNVSMTLFWVVFLLAFAYLTLFVGDLYRLINPWASIVEAIEWVGVSLSKARLAYPRSLAYWPAFILYAALIWMELFVAATPKALSTALLIYSAITVAGVALFGKAVWFERADPFAVFFRLIGVLAPIEYRASGEAYARLRAPFSGAIGERADHAASEAVSERVSDARSGAVPDHLSLVVFMLLVLAATSYDAIHETTLWVGLYWKNLLALLQPLWGEDLGKAQDMLMGGYLLYRQAGLIAFPFFYLLLYMLCLGAAKALTRASLSLRTLALHFAYSLLPIAIAYHFTHYFPFLLAEAGNLAPRLSDPFGFGWNLLGLGPPAEAAPLQMNFIWHTQVAVLILGHLVSVYLSHRVAIRVFPTRRQAIVSQLPLLVLMVAYTIFGMWILSLPLAE